MKLVVGMKVKYLPQPEWGTGHLAALHDNGQKAEVHFPSREGGPVLVSSKQGALVPNPLETGDLIRVKQKAGRIAEEIPGARGLRRYLVRFDDGTEDELPESEIRALPPKPDLLSTLRECRVGDARNFALRKEALILDEERRCDALGALLASRVMVKPHQVGVVQRVLSARWPRFILADEVGLGKTIEAGMIFSALRLSGLANRVLIVAPSHLTVQWLVELFHKFNQLFTLMDSERYGLAVRESPGVSPWAVHSKVITSLELLARNEEYRREAAGPEAYWDLVIFDEAHHLKAAQAFEVAQSLATNSWGLLLLTATPMQLDPAEYHGLLRLIDPSVAPTLDEFQQRLARQEELSAAVRSLLAGGKTQETLKALARRFPADQRLKTLKDRDEALAHLAETYSLSDRLIRNRRAVVGGFAERRLRRYPVTIDPAERATRDAALQALRSGSLRGAVLSDFVRRLDSSPAALIEALRNLPAPSSVEPPKLTMRDAKFNAFSSVLSQIWDGEPGAKILVFTEARATLDWLQEELRKERIEALVYHGDLPLVDRDHQVARFRDPDGPRVLICTEVGGEGRNFQFSHHLVNYDLPWSPAVMEQRIGRLDRIGQTRPVDIHVFDVQGTFASDVLSILANSVGVFGETVGGLDAVLEGVEGRLASLALVPAPERAEYAQQLKVSVQAAREQIRHAYDPLLDQRSFDRDAVNELVSNGLRRMEEPPSDSESLEDGMWTIARDLDERLEETVADLARRIGIGVDTDDRVDAFQCAFHFGHELKVEALPGININEEKTILGTFWRDTALEQEEIDYFTTGHSLVEALFAFLKDGPFGRNGFHFLEQRGLSKAKGIEFLFTINPPEPADTSPGARIPSRHLARFVDQWLLRIPVILGPDGKPKSAPDLRDFLKEAGHSLRGDEIRQAFPGFESFVDPAVKLAAGIAENEMKKIAASAAKAAEVVKETILRRMNLALSHQGVPPTKIRELVEREGAYFDALDTALGGLSLKLDSACGFVINR